jgi:protein involved in plasmid replication-relaxation
VAPGRRRTGYLVERGRCKPDGYGCYVRDGLKYGFFLEYDRGTESRRQYAAKFRAYYRYRDSRQAQRDYDGFPTLLGVTTNPVAEYRIAEEAYRAWAMRNYDPLPCWSRRRSASARATRELLAESAGLQRLAIGPIAEIGNTGCVN